MMWFDKFKLCLYRKLHFVLYSINQIQNKIGYHDKSNSRKIPPGNAIKQAVWYTCLLQNNLPVCRLYMILISLITQDHACKYWDNNSIHMS